MDKKQKTRLQLIIVSLVISAVGALLVGWLAEDVLGWRFAPVFAIALLLIFVPSSRSMMKIRISDTGMLETDMATRAMEGSGATGGPTREPKSFRRIVMRGLLIGLFGLATAFIVAAIHLSSRLGINSLHRMWDPNSLPTEGIIVVGALGVGILVAAVLEFAKGWPD